MRVSFAGPILKVSKDGDESEFTAGNSHPVEHAAIAHDSNNPSQLQPFNIVQPPKKAKFRKMVNKIRAVNTFKNKQVTDAVQFMLFVPQCYRTVCGTMLITLLCPSSLASHTTLT